MLGAIVPNNIPVLGLALSCGMLFTKTLPSIKVVPPGILSVNTRAVHPYSLYLLKLLYKLKHHQLLQKSNQQF